MLKRHSTLIGLNISVFSLMTGQGMIAILLPQRLLELAVSEASAGFLASAYALTYILVQVPLGRMSDRCTFKPFLMAGYLLIGLAGLVYHFAGSAELVYIGRMIHGLGEAPLWALAPALMSIQYPLIKGRLFGLYNAALNLGLMVGPLMTLALLSRRWQGSLFLVFAGIAFAGAVLIQLLVREQKHVPHQVSRIQYGNWFHQLKQAHVRDVLVGVFLYGGTYGLFVSTIPAFLLQTKGLDHTGAGLYFTLVFFSMGASQLLSGPLTDRWRPGWFMTGGLLLAAGGLYAFPETSGFQIHLSLLTAGMGVGIFGVTSLVFINEQVDYHHKGEISGLYYLFWAFGYMVLPLTGACLGHRLGLPLFFRSCAGLVLVAALLSARTLTSAPRKRGQKAKIW